jgi:hypothetical protein
MLVPVDPKLKERIRSELFRCPIAGDFLTVPQSHTPGVTIGNIPCQSHFDEIANEERANGYPGITFLVNRAGPPPQLPAQINIQASQILRRVTSWIACEKDQIP